MKILSLMGACAAGVLWMGCNGTDTGNPMGSGNNGGNTAGTGGLGNEGGYGCDVTDTTELQLTADTSLGVTAAEVLALAEGEQTFELAWLGEPDSWGEPAGTTTQAALRVTMADGGGARLLARTPAEPNGDGPAIEIAPAECDDLIEVDVVVELATEDGTLDERFDAVLRASGSLSATWSAKLTVEDLDGSFEYTASNPDLVATALSASATHTGLGIRGDISVEAQSEGPNGVASSGPLARWPADNDCTEGVPAALDAEVGELSIQGALETAKDALPAEITWPDADAAGLTWEITLDEDSGCVSLPTGGDPTANLQATGSLHLVSDDGRLDTEMPIHLRANGDDQGSLLDVTLRHGGRTERIQADQFEATYGLADVDLGDYDEVSLELRWTLDLTESEGAEGTLTVYGLDVPDCISNPQPQPIDGNGGGGSAGCRGIDSTPLFEAVF